MEANQEVLKRCSKCGVTQTILNFNKNSSHSDGYRSECKFCKQEADRVYRNSKKVRNIQVPIKKDVKLNFIQRLFNGFLWK